MSVTSCLRKRIAAWRPAMLRGVAGLARPPKRAANLARSPLSEKTFYSGHPAPCSKDRVHRSGVLLHNEVDGFHFESNDALSADVLGPARSWFEQSYSTDLDRRSVSLRSTFAG